MSWYRKLPVPEAKLRKPQRSKVIQNQQCLMSKPKQTIVPSETIYVAILIHVTLYTCYVYTVLLLHVTLPVFIKPQVVNVFTRIMYSPLFKAGDVRELLN